MPFAIIADWDGSNRVTRYNLVDTEPEAIAIVDRLLGVGDDPLPPAKQAPNAYYVEMPPAPAGTALFQHRARFWVADPGAGTVSFDAAACHAWQSDLHKRVIDREADRRADEVFSPGDPGRAGRVRGEMPPGGPRNALEARVGVLRTAAQALKDSLGAMTPEEILAVDPSDDAHWPE